MTAPVPFHAAAYSQKDRGAFVGLGLWAAAMGLLALAAAARVAGAW